MPPQHSATAQIRFIRSTDPAWDLDCVEEERKRLGKRTDEHPIPVYFAGESRYDLDAPGPVDGETKSPRQYLRPEVKPRAWLGRRLGIAEVARCHDVGGSMGELEAFAMAVVGCENFPEPAPTIEQGPARRLSASLVDEIAERLGMAEVFEVGRAMLLASRAPTSAEKKP